MSKISEITPIYTDNIKEPIKVELGKLYINEKYGTANHLCPCGCGGHVSIPLRGEIFWTIDKKENGLISLRPSINNDRLECKSHYSIIDNKIVW